MSKADDLLKACQQNLENWTCAYCASNSTQPAATFRELKKQGYKFEECAPQRWGKTILCDKCGTKRTHYKLLEIKPSLPEKTRLPINNKQRDRIIRVLGGRDAFTGASISSTPEIDHKVPWIRLTHDIDASSLSDKQIIEYFQLLTREHNLLKDRACKRCIADKKRTPLFEIPFWYAGDENYNGSCVGCGWHDGKKWREELSKILKMIN
ncbi:MAG: hypothetical protein NC396_02500 [Bacteroides sp.]|nr:hypothetical protein [Bacteroides sp.]MCM1085061.1 hypothetical protein [Bacteroides sp.]